MKSEREIREKISELEEKRAKLERTIYNAIEEAKNPISIVLAKMTEILVEMKIEILEWVLGESEES